MKKVWVLITLMAIVVLSTVQIGCQKKEKPAAPMSVESKQTEASPAEAPAAENPDMAKPKDHPAH